VLRALILWIERRRCQPSMKELAKAVGVATVQHEIDRLETKGWIRRPVSGVARSIQIPADVFDEVVRTGELPEIGRSVRAETETTENAAGAADTGKDETR
jgi:SOS-response transcriptional repressor LexA